MQFKESIKYGYIEGKTIEDSCENLRSSRIRNRNETPREVMGVARIFFRGETLFQKNFQKFFKKISKIFKKISLQKC